LKQRLIAVGDSADIEIVFSTGKYSGSKKKGTTVVTSDITKGNKKLFLHANIARHVDTLGGIILTDPPFVDVTQDERDREFEVTVTSLADVPLSLKLVSAPYEVFEIEYSSKAIMPGESTTMKIRITEGAKVKTAKKSFTFELDDAKRTRFTVPVRLLAENRQAIQPTAKPEKPGGGI
jgi:hypothetical protein